MPAGARVFAGSGDTPGPSGSWTRQAATGRAGRPWATPRAFEFVAGVADDLGSAAVASLCARCAARGIRGSLSGAPGGSSPAGGLAGLGALSEGAGPGQSADDAGQPASRHSCGAALLQPRFALP